MATQQEEPDADRSGLLVGLAGKGREERAELIAWLLEQGFDIDHIRNSFSPMLLPANRVIGDDGALVSSREIAESSGVDVGLLQRLQRAVGLVHVADPDARVHSRADAESVLRAAQFVNLGFDPEQVVLIVRLLMEGLTGAAAAIRQNALQVLLRPGATELELTQALETLARQVQPRLGPLIDDLFRVALRHSFETEAINAAERAAGNLPGAREVAVAFADLVGFTRLGEQLSPEELGLVAGRLTDLARDVVVDPVQFVKAIGDAVMLVCADTAKLLITVLNLVEAAGTADLPRLRVGIALGHAVSRAGDWYGSPVNLASRVTSVAPPGTVLVTEGARRAAGGAAGVTWAAAEVRHLKGVSGEVRLFVACRNSIG